MLNNTWLVKIKAYVTLSPSLNLALFPLKLVSFCAPAFLCTFAYVYTHNSAVYDCFSCSQAVSELVFFFSFAFCISLFFSPVECAWQ